KAPRRIRSRIETRTAVMVREDPKFALAATLGSRSLRARTTPAVAAGSEATGGPEKLGYRPGLDGLRAVAVFGGIGYHYYHRPTGGANGVELFFVLSGFLITSLLMEEWRERGRISLSRFYLRRALRLLPALWFMLLGWTVISLVTG